MEELLNIYDNDLKIINVLPRSVVHQKKLLHAVIHLWLVDLTNHKIYFQKRSASKKSYPSYYDIAVAGHIASHELPIEACLRETKEEIHLNLNPSDLTFLGAMIEHFENESELAYVFVATQTNPSLSLSDEVQEILTIDLENFLNNIRPEPFCPHNDELFIQYLKTAI